MKTEGETEKKTEGEKTKKKKDFVFETAETENSRWKKTLYYEKAFASCRQQTNKNVSIFEEN